MQQQKDVVTATDPSMKVPPKRKGNHPVRVGLVLLKLPSMKVPPKRKGNLSPYPRAVRFFTLNESPSEKEGKSPPGANTSPLPKPSMKVPPKRKGNFHDTFSFACGWSPQ